MQGDPGKVRKLGVIRLWVYGPLVSSPEALYADEDSRTGRGDRDGANIGTRHYEIRSPGVCGSPACIGRR